MKKDLGVMGAIYPMPVLMIATYDEDGKVDVMNAAWGSMCGRDKIALFISEPHKTTKNIRKVKAFTVSIANAKNVKEADFFGIASGNDMTDKFERTGFTAIKSEHVNAPIIDEFPICMECELAEIVQTDNLHAVVGKIVNVCADEEVISDGKVDADKLDAIAFDTFKAGYYKMGAKAAGAWDAGKSLM